MWRWWTNLSDSDQAATVFLIAMFVVAPLVAWIMHVTK